MRFHLASLRGLTANRRRYDILFNISQSLNTNSLFFDISGSVRMCSDLFRCVRMRSDVFGHVRMRWEAFGRVSSFLQIPVLFSDIFKVFGRFGTFSDVLDDFGCFC